MLHFDWARIFQHGVGRNTPTYLENPVCLNFGIGILKQKDTQLEVSLKAKHMQNFRCLKCLMWCNVLFVQSG